MIQADVAIIEYGVLSAVGGWALGGYFMLRNYFLCIAKSHCILYFCLLFWYAPSPNTHSKFFLHFYEMAGSVKNIINETLLNFFEDHSENLIENIHLTNKNLNWKTCVFGILYLTIFRPTWCVVNILNCLTTFFNIFRLWHWPMMKVKIRLTSGYVQMW